MDEQLTTRTLPLEVAETHGPVSATDVAAYIADMVAELRTLANQSQFDTLARVLDIAEREAKWRANNAQ